MAEPIKIDLHDLTPEKLAECEPHLGTKRYNAPCVIGALMPPDFRETVSNVLRPGMITSICFPPEQEKDINAIQVAFDEGRWPEVERIAAKYIFTPTDADRGEVDHG